MSLDDDETMRALRARLRGSLDAIQPPPDMMARAQAAVAAKAARRVPQVWQMMAATAAGLVAGVVLTSAGSGGAPLRPDLQPGGVLRAALARTASGSVRTDHGVRVSPRYTILAADGRACRAFRLEQGQDAYEGAACREGREWRVLALVQAAPRGQAFAQAATDEPAAIAAAFDALNPSDPLSADAERALISRRWKE